MKAAVLFELGKPLVIEQDLEPPPLREGQLLVRLRYSGVCHSQLMEARGRRGPDRFLPHLLGHEGAGIVLETGPGVTKVRQGDTVVLGWIKGRGIEAGGSVFRRGALEVNAGGVTTFNELAVVSENRVVPLPEGIPLDVAVLFGCAIPTGAGIVTNEIKPVPESTIAVFGLGGIGLSALMATMLYECELVIAVDVSEDKLALAREFGAHATVNSAKEDAVARIRELTNGRGVDYSVEASGLCEVIESAFEAVRRGGGLCVFASHPEFGKKIRIDPFDLISGKQIRGSWGGACDPDIDIPRFARLYVEGRLPLERLLSRRYRLDEINEALDDLEARRVARPLLDFGAQGR